ncbi:MAG: ATP-binding protein [Desulfuromonas sp.]|nr:ATP-binding protein [Desulfuromonas sp.]
MAKHTRGATIRVAAELASLERLQSFVRTQAQALGLAEENYLKLEFVTEELVVNVVSYAYPDQSGEVELECMTQQDPAMFCVTIRDWGRAFNPLEQDAPNIQLSCEEREVGGLGIFLIGEMADSISYQYRDGANELTFGFKMP